MSERPEDEVDTNTAPAGDDSVAGGEAQDDLGGGEGEGDGED